MSYPGRSRPLSATRTTEAATPKEGRREVSRGHSSPSRKAKAKGRILKGKEVRRDSKTHRTRASGREARAPEERTPDVTGEVAPRAGQTSSASNQTRTLASNLMAAVLDRDNLNRAYRQVKANKGAPGVDGLTVRELAGWITTHKESLLAALAAGTYEPQPVRAVDIDKPGGGKRRLGIPAVVDRLIQQAILQVLQPLYEPKFTTSSYGFRPGKSAHQALQAGAAYVAQGRRIVVDIDLSNFFDRVCHDKLMGLLAKDIGDKVVLKLIRRYLEAGMFVGGLVSERTQGVPQGGPLSPLLSNVLLNELDWELERRGHRYCRYADDCNIYVKSEKAGARVMQTLTRYLEERLKLKVNSDKSAVAAVGERKFLGYRITDTGTLLVSPQSLARLQARIQAITRRNRGDSLETVVGELRSYLLGWIGYYRLTDGIDRLRLLDSWIRRKVRCYRLKQTRRGKGLVRFLKAQGVHPLRARKLGSSGIGWWRMSRTPQASIAMPNSWVTGLGLPSLVNRYYELNPFRKPPDTLSMSGGVGGRRG